MFNVQCVPVGTRGYQEYQEDQDQISDATYISDVVFQYDNYLPRLPSAKWNWTLPMYREIKDPELKP